MIVENEAQEAQVPEIWETEEEKSLSIGKLKYCYLQIAKEKFQGNIYTNKDTQNPIRVSRDGIMEWWRKSRKREHLISVQLLDYFLEKGVLLGKARTIRIDRKLKVPAFLRALVGLMGFRLRQSSPLGRVLMI